MINHSKSTSGLIISTILLITLGVVMISFDLKKEIPLVRDNVQIYFASPIKIASSWPESLKKNVARIFTEKNNILKENEELKREIIWLKANLANQTAIEAEYRRLKKLFESTAMKTRPVMIAEVLDSQIDASRHQIEINKGRNANVFDGQIVIDKNGVVGQVTSVSEIAAIVSLITDERQVIPVYIERNRVRMLARGSGSLSDLEMEFVDKAADVRVGDKLITSGLGARYPRGYSIGVITEVDNSPVNEFMQVHAKPLAALDKALEVLLISPSEDDTQESNSSINDNTL